ncbi:MAG: class II fructose-bisphosphate aldolase [Bacteroidetes bacterium]|nr:class II fructose-bisphosphate aldolase [Bacteroidota bacterium]
MKVKDKLLEFKAQGRALLAVNFYNYETLAGIVKAAAEMKEPIILQLSGSSIQYLGLNVAIKMAHAALEQYDVEGWLHLDHGSSVEMARLCLAAGFDSVMIDASEKTFDENIRITRNVVEMASATGSCVESELGYVAKLGQQQNSSGFTRPEEAMEFVEKTGVDMLAVAIGSAHGFYKEEPHLDLDRLEQIRKVTAVPLVLHGSSGIPDQMLRDAISHGIVKINLATESKNAFMKELKIVLLNTNEIDLRKTFPPAIEAVKNVIIRKLKLISMT